MQVILMERIGNLGDLGDEVAVKNGYGRNFLIPQGKAVRATKANREVFETRRAELEKAANDRLTAAQGRARSLEGASVTIAARAEEGKLYGSVGPKEISDALTGQYTDIAPAEVLLPEGPIREVGEYEIELTLHSDVNAVVQVIVIPAA
jgi:large subunit ribosomal protein L9